MKKREIIPIDRKKSEKRGIPLPYFSGGALLEGGEIMKIEYDPEHDLMNIEFISEEPMADSVEFDGIIVDYSKDRKIVAIEILDVGKRSAKYPLESFDLTIIREKTTA